MRDRHEWAHRTAVKLRLRHDIAGIYEHREFERQVKAFAVRSKVFNESWRNYGITMADAARAMLRLASAYRTSSAANPRYSRGGIMNPDGHRPPEGGSPTLPEVSSDSSTEERES